MPPWCTIWHEIPAFVVAVLLVTVIGIAVHWLIMRPLQSASTLARVVATLGLLAVLQGAAALLWTQIHCRSRRFCVPHPVRRECVHP